MCGNHLCVEGPITHLLVRLFEVPDHSREVPIFGREHCLRIIRVNTVSLQRMEVFVSEESRLANTLRVQEPKTALKWSCRRARFLEQIGVGPIAHRSEERRVRKECRSRWSPY